MDFKKIDPNSKEGKKKIGIIAAAIIVFLSIVESAGLALIPLAIFGAIGYSIYKSSKKKNVDENGFDYDKSYSKRKDVEDGLLESQRLEQEYLKGRNYSSNKVNENNLFYDRKTTNFDKSHAHNNMYPTQSKATPKTVKKVSLTKEEQLVAYQKELKKLKKEYNDYQIGILEFREKENELKTKINTLKKDILEQN